MNSAGKFSLNRQENQRRFHGQDQARIVDLMHALSSSRSKQKWHHEEDAN